MEWNCRRWVRALVGSEGENTIFSVGFNFLRSSRGAHLYQRFQYISCDLGISVIPDVWGVYGNVGMSIYNVGIYVGAEGQGREESFYKNGLGIVLRDIFSAWRLRENGVSH